MKKVFSVALILVFMLSFSTNRKQSTTTAKIVKTSINQKCMKALAAEQEAVYSMIDGFIEAYGDQPGAIEFFMAMEEDFLWDADNNYYWCTQQSN